MLQQWLKDPKIILALPIWIYPLELPLSPIVFIRKWFSDGFIDN